MERIESFSVDHLCLEKGLYVSRKDRKDNTVITSFDIRLTAPNREPVVDMPALHTIEHLGATFLRNSARTEDIVYFGPMGCRTGCYLVMFGDLTPQDIYPLIKEMCEFIISFNGDIPGAKAEQCGNYLEQNLGMAKYYIKNYLSYLQENKNVVYKSFL